MKLIKDLDWRGDLEDEIPVAQTFDIPMKIKIKNKRKRIIKTLWVWSPYFKEVMNKNEENNANN